MALVLEEAVWRVHNVVNFVLVQMCIVCTGLFVLSYSMRYTAPLAFCSGFKR